MLLLTLIIFNTITLSYAEHEVCESCTEDDDCRSDIAGIEECTILGDGNKYCYWEDPDIVIIGDDAEFIISRECVDDHFCAYGIEGVFDAHPWDHGTCLRCCPNAKTNKNLCTATIGGEQCGSLTEAIFGTIAPCCPGEFCLDNVYGVCAVESFECESCVVLTAYEGRHIVHKHSCSEGLMCLVDNESPDIPFEDPPYSPYWYHNLIQNGDESTVIFNDGICVPENGISDTTTCEDNKDCPRCMRCCANSEGNKQCVRSSGDSYCGLSFEDRGPCCCPEDVCKLNECKSPSSGDDFDDDADENSGEDQEFFGAKMIDENENSGGEYIFKINDNTLINIWGIVLVGIIALIICAYVCSHGKRKASFEHEVVPNV